MKHKGIEALRMALEKDPCRLESKIGRCLCQNLYHSIIQFIHCKHNPVNLLDSGDKVHQRHAPLDKKGQQRHRIKIFIIKTDLFAFSGKGKQAFHRKHFFFSGILHSILAIKPLIDSFSFT